MTTEQLERLKSCPFCSGTIITPEEVYHYPDDDDYICSSCGARAPKGQWNIRAPLLDSQAAGANYTRPTGWQAATQRADPRVVTVTFENRECAEAFMEGLEPADGPVTSATTMRSRCVEKVRAIGAKIQPGEDCTEFHALIVEIIEELEAVSLEQQEKQS